MGEILGIGTTHYPPAVGPAENMANILKGIMRDPGLPEKLRDPANWPEKLQAEWGDDQGASAGRRHQQALQSHFKRARQALEEFNPDVVIIWGDDQYENFKEDIIPPFCVQAYEEITIQPFKNGLPNAWGEPADKTFTYKGHREAGKYLARRLIEQDIEMSYAYQPGHHPLAHAFANTLMFLDYERQGFPWPVIPFQVNCYGSKVIAQRGGRGSLLNPVAEGDLDPPSPSFRRCMQVGAAVARAAKESPWKVAMVASSSWSHAFLVDKFYQLHPDHEQDIKLYEALRDGNYDVWRNHPTSQVEESGQQEVLNWAMLAGAMEELGRKPDVAEFVEVWALNSNKVFALFKP